MQFSSSPPLAAPHVSWLLWPLALLAGFFIAAGSLGYAPGGRINVLWIWLLWAGLPLLGSLVSLWTIFFGGQRPWLFQWRNHGLHWHPSPLQRLQMLALLQRAWCLVALGMLAGYWTLLLFSDLAFGWSSTLIDNSSVILQLARSIAWPWQWLWPTAVPDAALIDATRYVRIAPAAGNTGLAGDWWRFLMASLLCYNLLPRLLLRAVIALRQRSLRGHELNVRAPGLVTPSDRGASIVNEDSLTAWQTAQIVHWEIKPDARDELPYLGIGDWKHDEQAMQQLLSQAPERLVWQVNANRSPVAELTDLIAMARTAGVTSQALWAMGNTTTDHERHIASWRAFATKQQLVWLKDSP